MVLEVREARPDELDRAGAVVLAAYVADGLPESDYRARLRDARGRAADPGSTVIVAVDDGEVVGCVTWCPPGSTAREISEPDEGEFRMLGVAPEAQGRGVGRLLVDDVLRRGREAGLRAMVLCSGDWMTAAHGLYPRLGFTRLPERDWEPVPGVRLLGYRLDLDGSGVSGRRPSSA